MQMEIRILGTMSVTVDESNHAIRARKLRTILAVLALSPGQIVSFDELIDELWTECDLHNAKNALQANAMRLRKQLETYGINEHYGGSIRTINAGYVLEMPPEAIDGNRFLSLADTGAYLTKADPVKAIVLLQRALSLWRGPALTDTGDGFRCKTAAVRLEERRISAQEDLISVRLRVGEERIAVTELQQLVGRYPERERFSEQLMLALYRCGRQMEALAVFHSTRRWLSIELGLEPNRALDIMYQAILVHDPILSSN
jgi:SARP family transcriptional regulator, regulator of embCAB operon